MCRTKIVLRCASASDSGSRRFTFSRPTWMFVQAALPKQPLSCCSRRGFASLDLYHGWVDWRCHAKESVSFSRFTTNSELLWLTFSSSSSLLDEMSRAAIVHRSAVWPQTCCLTLTSLESYLRRTTGSFLLRRCTRASFSQPQQVKPA